MLTLHVWRLSLWRWQSGIRRRAADNRAAHYACSNRWSKESRKRTLHVGDLVPDGEDFFVVAGKAGDVAQVAQHHALPEWPCAFGLRVSQIGAGGHGPR